MNELEKLRTDPNTWGSVAFAASHSNERGTFDSNERARLRVLLALQYDRRESDIELIRHLFTNEIIAAENDSFQGFGRAFTLAAFLLAQFREPSDVSLFARAKFANFDTACGFPLQFMLFAGGNQTTHYLQANRPELWARLQSFDLTATCDDLEKWWQEICDDYPGSEEDEQLLALYERALSFDDRELALRYLEEWAAKEPDSDAKRSQLKYEYARLGDFESAAHIAADILVGSENLWDKASALRDLVKLHRQAGEFSLSLSAAQQLDTTLAAFDDWVGVGLGRMAIHEVFELSFSHPDAADASHAFAIADRCFQRSRDLALVGMDAGAKAARRCGLVQKAKEYERIADLERNRIDELMS
ncbi:MAG: hypothetical protein FD138_70 [Planctomycetota bacterium]|nr:MAG: hypothetical protein FD138_70 [Planctomycetota bacterium]